MTLHRVKPGQEVRLADIDPGDASAAPGGKTRTRAATAALVERLAELQELLWAGRTERLLVVLQGIDTSGKGGTLDHVLGAVHPVGLKVVSFGVPTEIERKQDFLWRIHPHVPRPGEIVVFDRSHYEDVLVVRAHDLLPESRWRPRYEHINAFERLLADEGTTIVKVLLHISRDEQRERLEARLAGPSKHWKFNPADLDARARWDDHQAAFGEAVTRTSKPHAPWHVVPADHKWYRDWAVATILVDTLERMGLTWPVADFDPAAIEVPR